MAGYFFGGGGEGGGGSDGALKGGMPTKLLKISLV